MSDKLPLKNASSGGLTFSIATILYFVASLICSALIMGLSIPQGSDGYVYINYLAAPIAIAATLTIVCKVRRIHFREIAPIKCSYKYYILAALLSFGLLFSLNWLNGVTVSFFKLFGYVEREAASYLPNLSGGYVVLALLVMSILPAIFEELLFRGAILNCIVRGVGSIASIFIVGFCFSIFHGSPEQTAYQFVCGCVFAFLAIRSGSIVPSIVAHFLNNAVIIVLYAAGQVDATGELMISQGGNIALITISALCLAGGILWLILDKKPLFKAEKGEKKNFFFYALVGIIMMAVVWIFNLLGVS